MTGYNVALDATPQSEPSNAAEGQPYPNPIPATEIERHDPESLVPSPASDASSTPPSSPPPSYSNLPGHDDEKASSRRSKVAVRPNGKSYEIVESSNKRDWGSEAVALPSRPIFAQPGPPPRERKGNETMYEYITVSFGYSTLFKASCR